MSHIFISYSSKNKNYANDLVKKLRDEGFDVWIDDRVDPGQEWWEIIIEALKSSNIIIVIMTEDSRSSRWVQREVMIAENEDKLIFPLLLGGKLWELFVTRQYEDVRDFSLPSSKFYDLLAEHVERKSQRGRVISPDSLENIESNSVSLLDSSSDIRLSKRTPTNNTSSLQALEKAKIQRLNDLMQRLDSIDSEMERIIQELYKIQVESTSGDEAFTKWENLTERVNRVNERLNELKIQYAAIQEEKSTGEQSDQLNQRITNREKDLSLVLDQIKHRLTNEAKAIEKRKKDEQAYHAETSSLELIRDDLTRFENEVAQIRENQITLRIEAISNEEMVIQIQLMIDNLKQIDNRYLPLGQKLTKAREISIKSETGQNLFQQLKLLLARIQEASSSLYPTLMEDLERAKQRTLVEKKIAEDALQLSTLIQNTNYFIQQVDALEKQLQTQLKMQSLNQETPEVDDIEKKYKKLTDNFTTLISNIDQFEINIGPDAENLALFNNLKQTFDAEKYYTLGKNLAGAIKKQNLIEAELKSANKLDREMSQLTSKVEKIQYIAETNTPRTFSEYLSKRDLLNEQFLQLKTEMNTFDTKLEGLQGLLNPQARQIIADINERCTNLDRKEISRIKQHITLLEQYIYTRLTRLRPLKFWKPWDWLRFIWWVFFVPDNLIILKHKSTNLEFNEYSYRIVSSLVISIILFIPFQITGMAILFNQIPIITNSMNINSLIIISTILFFTSIIPLILANNSEIVRITLGILGLIAAVFVAGSSQTSALQWPFEALFILSISMTGSVVGCIYSRVWHEDNMDYYGIGYLIIIFLIVFVDIGIAVYSDVSASHLALGWLEIFAYLWALVWAVIGTILVSNIFWLPILLAMIPKTEITEGRPVRANQVLLVLWIAVLAIYAWIYLFGGWQKF